MTPLSLLLACTTDSNSKATSTEQNVQQNLYEASLKSCAIAQDNPDAFIRVTSNFLGYSSCIGIAEPYVGTLFFVPFTEKIFLSPHQP